MIIHWDLEQQTDEWFKLKWASIGGTRLSKFMSKIDKPVTECAEFYNLLSEKIEDYEYEDSYISNAMETGIELEPYACEEFSRVYNIPTVKVGMIQSQNLPFNHCSPDRVILDNNDIKGVLEVKCPERKAHIKYCLSIESVIEDYGSQIINYFLTINELEYVYFVSYRPQNKIKPLCVYTFTNDSIIKFGKKYITIKIAVEIAFKRMQELEKEVNKILEPINKF